MCVCGQFVLFVGVTILLASTYVTMTTQEKLVQQESVVKRALPIDQHLDADRPDLPAKQLPRGVCYCMQLLAIVGCIQCFDTVGWAPVSIFFGSQKLIDEVLAWLSLWSEVQIQIVST